eukprot:scaffold22462_cov73-Cylindrotheca_fusiformis.AAC.1
MDSDLVMVDEYDFSFSPGPTNQYIPQELLDRDAMFEEDSKSSCDDDEDDESLSWRPFQQGGFLDVDTFPR